MQPCASMLDGDSVMLVSQVQDVCPRADGVSRGMKVKLGWRHLLDWADWCLLWKCLFNLALYTCPNWLLLCYFDFLFDPGQLCHLLLLLCVGYGSLLLCLLGSSLSGRPMSLREADSTWVIGWLGSVGQQLHPGDDGTGGNDEELRFCVRGFAEEGWKIMLGFVILVC